MSHMIKATALLGLLTLSTPAAAYPLTLCWDVAQNGASYDYTLTLVSTGNPPVGYINWLIFGDTGGASPAGATTISGATLLSAPAGTTWTSLTSSGGYHNGPTFLTYPLYTSGWYLNGSAGQSITWRVRGTNRVGDNDLYWSYLLGASPQAAWERGVRSLSWYRDADGDGYGDPSLPMAGCGSLTGYVNNSSDCNDADATVNPAAAEYCDGVDDDCDGVIDDNAVNATTWYRDGDNDAYGNPASTTLACNAPVGYTGTGADCNDANAAIHPFASEYCNATDDDCDGLIDEGAVDAADWYTDGDADGWGDPGSVIADCAQPSGTVADATDCDDSDADIHPGAAEYCDGADDDCDGVIDDNAVDTVAFYADVDGDNYGDAGSLLDACTQPAGYVPDATDCDDTDGAVYPGAAEYCNGIDDDCNGTIDDNGALDVLTWYADSDADGYGDPAVSADACTQPGGYVPDATDCDDARAASYPGAAEYCNGIDDDCNGTVDDNNATDVTPWYADTDGDGSGDPRAGLLSCDPPAGYVADGNDCDDGDAGVNPAAQEVCDPADTDEDCDGQSDDADSSAAGQTAWYADGDADGYGGNATTPACDQPAGHTAAATDCDDSRADIHPGAQEICDPLDTDEDCDGLSDDADSSADPGTRSTFYADGDSDGWGGATAGSFCDLPGGWSGSGGDCDDTDPAYNPGASETDCADPNDYNCDGSTGYMDADSDGYAACTECDDTDPDVNPGALEIAGDGADSDCDGLELCYADADGDGWRPDDAAQPSAYIACDGPAEIGAGSGTGDCDDTDAAYNPGAAEPDCTDPNDYNCDGSTGYTDADTDGFAACAECDDALATVNPDATEVCNLIDDDCDGTVDQGAADAQTFYADSDGDGFTDPDAPILSCAAPDGYLAATAEDCDDTDATIFPGAEDVPGDGIDQDCAGGDVPGDTGETGETGETGDFVPDSALPDSGKPDISSGDCGCSSRTGAAPMAFLLIGLAALTRRRSR